MDEVLTVRRWRRYGADRLFVTQETGARIGSVDLQSGEVVVDAPALEDGLRRAAQAYLRSDARADVTELVLPVPTAPADSLDAFDEAALQAWLGPDLRDEPDSTVHRGRRTSIGPRLDGLADAGWQVLHDVPLGRQGDAVEHLLLGPGGVFTVGERDLGDETVLVDGRVMSVDGNPVAHLRVARLEAARVQGSLVAAAVAGVTVRGVLVVQGNLQLVGPSAPEDVLVVPGDDIPGLFRRMPARLDPGRVTAITAIARRRTTWSR